MKEKITNKELLDIVTNIESELSSFEEDKIEVNNIINTDKKKLIKEVKNGLFDEILNDIEKREETIKKETFWSKLVKIFFT